jgi:hypothetical protein
LRTMCSMSWRAMPMSLTSGAQRGQLRNAALQHVRAALMTLAEKR